MKTCQSTAQSPTTEGRAGAIDIVDAWATFIIPHMTILPRFSVGRILLHLLAMLGDRCIPFPRRWDHEEFTLVATALEAADPIRTHLIGKPRCARRR